jgi:hypothetical protein
VHILHSLFDFSLVLPFQHWWFGSLQNAVDRQTFADNNLVVNGSVAKKLPPCLCRGVEKGFHPIDFIIPHSSLFLYFPPAMPGQTILQGL